jgi:hypothetical protein
MTRNENEQTPRPDAPPPSQIIAPQQVASIGRMVHFVYGDRHVPAIITDPANGITVYLTVFPVGEEPFTDLAAHDEETKQGGTWHWPEYVPSR